MLSSPVNKVSDRNCSRMRVYPFAPCSVCWVFRQYIHHAHDSLSLERESIVFHGAACIRCTCECVTYDKVMTTFNFQKAKAAMRLKFIVHTRLLSVHTQNEWLRKRKHKRRGNPNENWSENIVSFVDNMQSAKQRRFNTEPNLWPNGLDLAIAASAYKRSQMAWADESRQVHHQHPPPRNNNLKEWHSLLCTFSLRSFRLAFHFILIIFCVEALNSVLSKDDSFIAFQCDGRAHCLCLPIDFDSYHRLHAPIQHHGRMEDSDDRANERFPFTSQFIFDGSCVGCKLCECFPFALLSSGFAQI